MRTRREREDEDIDMREREDEVIELTVSLSLSPHSQQQNATSHQERGATGSIIPTTGQNTTSSQEDATGVLQLPVISREPFGQDIAIYMPQKRQISCVLCQMWEHNRMHEAYIGIE